MTATLWCRRTCSASTPSSWCVPPTPAPTACRTAAVIPADTSLETIKLQDAQNELNRLLDAVPPEDLAEVLGTIAGALKGLRLGVRLFGGIFPNYFDSILNAQFPAGAPPGFDNFDRSLSGLAQSAPELLDALGRSVIPAVTLAEKQRDLAALLSGTQGLLDQTQLMFARNGNGGQRLISDLNRMLGATVLEPNSLPEAIVALNKLAARVLTVFTGTNGPHVQLNIGVSFGAFVQYKRQNCPVYDGGPYGQLRGPGCVGPGTGTGPNDVGSVVPFYPVRRDAPEPAGRHGDHRIGQQDSRRGPAPHAARRPTRSCWGRWSSPSKQVTPLRPGREGDDELGLGFDPRNR